MVKRKKIVWLSANIFGLELLKESLGVKDVEICGIITISKMAKTKMDDGVEVSEWHDFNIPVYEVEDINKEGVKILHCLKPDIVVMAGWRQLVSKEILEIPRYGFIGFHPSLLPEGRGPAPIINSILRGIKKSGLTMFYVNEGMDSGDIIGQERFEIGENDYAADVYLKAIEAGRGLVKKKLPLLAQGRAPRIPQKEKEATYFPKRTLKDNEINLKKESLEKIYRKIRALSRPYRGAYITIKNKKIIIWKADLIK